MNNSVFLSPHRSRSFQVGASLIEVLVAILILSFGMLSLGSMMAYAVQLPKLAGYRAKAVTLAVEHIERMRANKGAFQAGTYNEALSYTGKDGTIDNLTGYDCVYPGCDATKIAYQDRMYTLRAVRRELPLGGMLVQRDVASGIDDGNLWIVWNEPTTFGALDAANSDNCPAEVAEFTDPKPRCLYVRFKL